MDSKINLRDKEYEPITQIIFSITEDNQFVLYSARDFKDSWDLKQHYAGEVLGVYPKLSDEVCKWLNTNGIPLNLEPGMYVFELPSRNLKKI